jgi:hypothetical protein
MLTPIEQNIQILNMLNVPAGNLHAEWRRVSDWEIGPITFSIPKPVHFPTATSLTCSYSRDVSSHRLNMEAVCLGSMSRDVHSCTHWLRPRNPPSSPALDSYTRALLVSKDRRHLFVTPCYQYCQY